MIQSLKRYARLFGATLLLKKEKLILCNHANSYYCSGSFKKKSFTTADKKVSLQLAVNWLLSAQQNMVDDGFGTYYIVDGWTSSYPETSGYIIPTLFAYISMDGSRREEVEKSILSCADWLVSIQKPSGGWQSAYMEHNREEVVFNTGQVLRGLLVAYHITSDKKYLDSMVKASHWLADNQEESGSWIKTAYMNQPRVYDSYVDHPLLQIWQLTNEEKFKRAAEKNLNWILTQQLPNGWWMNTDNTIKHNQQPILHTIAYTIDGLIESGLMLNNQHYVQAGKKAADRLLHIFNENGFLNGRFDRTWTPHDYIICTGCAQMSIAWARLYEITNEEKYKIAVEKMNNQLVFIQRSCLTIGGRGNGALPGSFPLWGKYEPFGFPNWATKYFADALMLEARIK